MQKNYKILFLVVVSITIMAVWEVKQCICSIGSSISDEGLVAIFGLKEPAHKPPYLRGS